MQQIILVYYLTFCLITFTSFQLSIQENLEELKKKVKDYEFIEPKQIDNFERTSIKRDESTNLNKTDHHPEKIGFYFTYNKTKYTIDLRLNNHLFVNNFSYSVLSDYGLKSYKLNRKKFKHCYYYGSIRGIQNSHARIKTCSGFEGYIQFPNDYLMIQKLDDGSYVAYHGNTETKNNFCGTTDKYTSKIDSKINRTRKFRSKRQTKFVDQISDEILFVEFMMISDEVETKKYIGQRDKLISRIVEINNFIDGEYYKLGVRIVLVHVEIWEKNPILINEDPENSVSRLVDYFGKQTLEQPKSSPWKNVDIIHVLYGGEFSGSTLGMATVRTVCSSKAAGITLNSPRPFDIAGTIAHELGHNFGMEHDTNSCTCGTKSSDYCIMSAIYGNDEKRFWSSCSREYARSTLDLGMGHCLTNVPDTDRIVGGPACGNFFVEEGEECDCGEPDECLSSCCDPTTCKLKPPAVCDAEACCENCQFATKGQQCRASSNQCDLPEFCTGSSYSCPEDYYIKNFSPCPSDPIHRCYDGVCLTRDLQCKAVWGSDSLSGDDECYDIINVLKDHNGNCGRTGDGKFRACKRKDVKCGKLLCQKGSRRPMMVLNRSFFYNTLSRTIECKSLANKEVESDEFDYGLVFDGTSCGTTGYCSNNECVEVPFSNCSSKCNDKGVCNNMGNCHCDIGWSPPFCMDASEFGGSEDSGPASETQTGSSWLSTLMIVIGVVLVLIGGLYFMSQVVESNGTHPKPSSGNKIENEFRIEESFEKVWNAFVEDVDNNYNKNRQFWHR